MGLRQEKTSLRDDERAIEGLPIRLVIALFVGVAALGLMLQVLGIFDEDQLSTNEATIELTDGKALDIQDLDEGRGTEVVTFEIRNGDGELLTGIEQVLVSPDTAQGETITVDVSGGVGNLTESDIVGSSDGELDASLRPDQTEGSFSIELLEADQNSFAETNPGTFTLLG